MKQFLAVATTLAVLLSFGVEPVIAEAPLSKKIELIEIIKVGNFTYELPVNITPKKRRILIDLIRCESGGNEKAINPLDKDGTASYGLLQFKPATLKSVMKLVGDEREPDLFNGELQADVFLKWYGNGKPVSWWKSQFPACSKRHNYWL